MVRRSLPPSFEEGGRIRGIGRILDKIKDKPSTSLPSISSTPSNLLLLLLSAYLGYYPLVALVT